MEKGYQSREWAGKVRHPAIREPIDRFRPKTSMGNSKDTVHYSTYGRGKDPVPDIVSYMHNPKLIRYNRSVTPVSFHLLNVD